MALLKRLVPRAWKQAFIDRILARQDPPTFDGIFEAPDSVPEIRDGYNNEIFVRRSADALLRLRAEAGMLPTESNVTSLILGLLETGRGVNVLDFGGSVGTHYWMASHTLGTAMPPVRWTVVELDGICAAGQAIWNDTLEFQTALPEGQSYDLVIASSSLQYSPDFRQTLAKLLACSSKYVVISNTPIGPVVRSFVSKHVNVENIFAWIISIEELREIVATAGFEILFTGTRHRKHNAGAFPEGYRLEHYLDVVLRRKGATS